MWDCPPPSKVFFVSLCISPPNMLPWLMAACHESQCTHSTPQRCGARSGNLVWWLLSAQVPFIFSPHFFGAQPNCLCWHHQAAYFVFASPLSPRNHKPSTVKFISSVGPLQPILCHDCTYINECRYPTSGLRYSGYDAKFHLKHISPKDEIPPRSQITKHLSSCGTAA